MCCFYQRGKTDKANTKAVWVYDMRANMPAFGKTTPLTVQDFAGFEKPLATIRMAEAKRKDQGEEGRWRCLPAQQIKARNDNLDIAWLRDTEAEAEEQLTSRRILPPPLSGTSRRRWKILRRSSDELEPER